MWTRIGTEKKKFLYSSMSSISSLTPSSIATSKDEVIEELGKDRMHQVEPNCKCGCVPNVKSLFEMAALRAEYRKKQKMLQENIPISES